MYSSFNLEPDIPASLGLLSHLPRESLKDLLNDEDKLDTILKDIKQLKDLETEKEFLIGSNRSLAEFNLSKEPELQEKRETFQRLCLEGKELCDEYKKKVAELKEKSGGLTPDTLQTLLEHATSEAEEESEAVASKFLNGDLDPDNFLDQFLSCRKTMHLRRVRVDKLAELLHTPQTPSQSASGPQSFLPYPSRDANMPSVNFNYSNMFNMY